MRQIQISLKANSVYALLTRSYKVEQIQDGLNTDPVTYFIYSVNCETKQMQDSLKMIPKTTSLARKL
jgi:hypothetical protein